MIMIHHHYLDHPCSIHLLTSLPNFLNSKAIRLRRIQNTGYKICGKYAQLLCDVGCMKKNTNIEVKGIAISMFKEQDADYISLTDMLKAKDGDFFISDWLRNRNTIEFLGVWQTVNIPHFNYGEFAIIRTQAGLNSYKVSAREWIEKTNAIGIKSTAGRYGGTFAHADIALEFGMWISPEFKVYLIKEFQRLKAEETRELSSGWNLQRTLSKINYHILTDAIKEKLIPKLLSAKENAHVYASEADLLNMVLFGKTAAQWKKENSNAIGNIRDHASLEQLVILSNLESLNAVLIHQGIAQTERLLLLNKTAIQQMKTLLNRQSIKQLSK